MLEKFEVSGFKQFKHLVLDFSHPRDYEFSKNCLTKDARYLKTLLVYGPNASGKSNFGYAIFDIVQHLFDNFCDTRPYECYLNADSPDTPAEFKYSFIFERYRVRYEYKKRSSKVLVAEALYVNGNIVFSWDSETKTENFRNLEKYGLGMLTLSKESSASLLRNVANNSNLTKAPFITRLMDFVGSMLWFRRSDSGNNRIEFFSESTRIEQYIIDNNLLKDFEAFLHHHGIREKLEIHTSPDGKLSLFCKHQKSLPFYLFASSGTATLAVSFYWLHFFKKAGFIFMDDFDAFYHPQVASEIFKQVISIDRQFILTTHNTNLLNTNVTRPDCCFIMQEGLLSSFADKTQRTIRQGNNLEKLFLSGEFDS